jgi:hypothetical protein
MNALQNLLSIKVTVIVVSKTYLFYASTKCCDIETGTSGTEIFCLSGTVTGMHYGSMKWDKKVKNEKPTS